MLKKVWMWLKNEDNREALKFIAAAIIATPPLIFGITNWINKSSVNELQVITPTMITWKEYRDSYLSSSFVLGHKMYRHAKSGQEFIGNSDKYLSIVTRASGRLSVGDIWNDSYQDIEVLEINADLVSLRLTDSQDLIDQLLECCDYETPESPKSKIVTVSLGGHVRIETGYEGGIGEMYVTEIVGSAAIRYEVFSYPFENYSFYRLKELANMDDVQITNENFGGI